MTYEGKAKVIHLNSRGGRHQGMVIKVRIKWKGQGGSKKREGKEMSQEILRGGPSHK